VSSMPDATRAKLNRLQEKLVRCTDGQDACETIELEIMLIEDQYPVVFNPAARVKA